MPHGEWKEKDSDREAMLRAFECDVAEAFLPAVPQPTYDIPTVECAVFGAYEKQAVFACDTVRRFLSLPVIPYRFSDHHAWSAWKVRMRETYGEAFANEQLRRFEQNKLRSNTLSSISLAAEQLIMACERGNERDRAFAERIDRQWNPSAFIRSVEEYRTLPVAEGVRAMAFFDRRALELVALIRHETQVRIAESHRFHHESPDALAAK
jgi:hypothetical protein